MQGMQQLKMLQRLVVGVLAALAAVRQHMPLLLRTAVLSAATHVSRYALLHNV